MENSVIKIIDGILISNYSVAQDKQFLYNNKVSHAVGWIQQELYISEDQFECIDVKSIYLPRRSELPSADEIEAGVGAILQSRDEYLCCLIYCQDVANSISFVIAYLICRFGWSLSTAISFVENRLRLMEIVNLNEHIEVIKKDIPLTLTKILGTNLNKLKEIKWNQTFLFSFKTEDMEELLLIQTVKNTLQPQQQYSFYQPKKSTKGRITWFDQTKYTIPVGQRLFANSKINNSLKKTMIANRAESRTSIKVFPLANNNLSNSFNSQHNSSQNPSLGMNTIKKKVNKSRISSSKKLFQSLKRDQFQDFDYLSLKQLSRTNFEDLHFQGTPSKSKGSLKLGKYYYKSTNSLSSKNIGSQHLKISNPKFVRA